MKKKTKHRLAICRVNRKINLEFERAFTAALVNHALFDLELQDAERWSNLSEKEQYEEVERDIEEFMRNPPPVTAEQEKRVSKILASVSVHKIVGRSSFGRV